MAISIVGILNITEDSFSDGGRYLEPGAALARADHLAKDGADIIDLGAASSNPDGKLVPPDIEIARLAPVVAKIKAAKFPVSVDSFSPEVQRWALVQDVDYVNDVRGFPYTELYETLAGARAKLIVMHAVQEGARAERISVDPAAILDRVLTFFEARVGALVAAGIARERLILDPGMGLFLGTKTEASYAILRRLRALKEVFALPVLVSVSRKSFLRKLTGRPPGEAGPASLAAELFAAREGADYIRTHDPGALKDGLIVQEALLGSNA